MYHSLPSKTLITEFNELGSNRYYDPRSRQSFKYDHLREETSDLQQWTPDPTSEPWRSALEEVWSKYCADHYHNGVSAVFGTSQNGTITLTACIEDHQFQPKNYWSVTKHASSRPQNKGFDSLGTVGGVQSGTSPSLVQAKLSCTELSKSRFTTTKMETYSSSAARKLKKPSSYLLVLSDCYHSNDVLSRAKDKWRKR